MIENVVISAPFGNYLNFENTTRTYGTYTLRRRASPFKLWWKVLSTVRYNWRTQSWTNKLGLPSPGIETLDFRKASRHIISIHGFYSYEWIELVEFCGLASAETLEFNYSCPNVAEVTVEPTLRAITLAHRAGIRVIAKLPPIRWMDYVVKLYGAGVTTFHLCNSMPTPGGGRSGKSLLPYSLWAVDEVKQKYGDSVKIIGGGGITTLDDVIAYKKYGADYIALGSMLFNPFNWKKVEEFNWYLGGSVPHACL